MGGQDGYEGRGGRLTIEIEIWIFEYYFIHKIQERNKGNCTAEIQIDNFHFGRAMFLRVTNCFVNISMF